jgi:hypothetical protein
MILFYCSTTTFLLLVIFINTASSVSFEANKFYKILNKLFITKNKQISIPIRIKVWIFSKNQFIFHINCTLYLNFCSKYSNSCQNLLRESLRKILDFIVGKYLFSTIFVNMKWVLIFFVNNY